MKKFFLIFSCCALILLAAGSPGLHAEEESGDEPQEEEKSVTAVEHKVDFNSPEMKAFREGILEEKHLKEQIAVAKKSGDLATAEQLNEKLTLMHQEHLQGLLKKRSNASDSVAAGSSSVIQPDLDSDSAPGDTKTGWATKLRRPPQIKKPDFPFSPEDTKEPSESIPPDLSENASSGEEQNPAE